MILLYVVSSTQERRELPFEAEDEVKWPAFTEVMNALFQGYTKRCLTEDNIRFLAMKAFSTSRAGISIQCFFSCLLHVDTCTHIHRHAHMDTHVHNRQTDTHTHTHTQ